MSIVDRGLQRWRILKVLPHIPKGCTLLDVGTGDGQMLNRLGSKIRRGIGVDPLLNAEVVRDRYTLIPARFPEGVRFPPGMFDAITMLAVLEHFPLDLLPSCRKACEKLLRPMGYLIITIPSPHVDIVLRILRYLRLVDAETLHQHYGLKPESVVEIFSCGSFSIIKNAKFQLGLNHLFVFQKQEKISRYDANP
jgi:cyclopropane fatty-acyl-phospholipid synthase-like methyltransferase